MEMESKGLGARLAVERKGHREIKDDHYNFGWELGETGVGVEEELVLLWTCWVPKKEQRDNEGQ